MPTTPNAINSRTAQVDANDSGLPYDEPMDTQNDGLPTAAVFFHDTVTQDKSRAIWPDGDDLRFRDGNNQGGSGEGFTLTELISGVGGGVTASQHEELDTLVHNIAESSFDEPIYTGNRVDVYPIYTDNTKTTYVRKEEYTYTGNKVTTIVRRQYDGAGAEVTAKRITEVITYTGPKVANIERSEGP